MSSRIEQHFQPHRQEANLTDKQVRILAIDSVVDEFLTVSEINLDERIFLLETTLPSLVIASERLLREIERRQVNSLSIATSVAIAGESDKPNPKFNPINWLGILIFNLAQDLFRRSSSAQLSGSAAAYSKRTKHISAQLHQRIQDIKEERLAAKILHDERVAAQEAQRIEENAKREMEIIAHNREHQRVFTEILQSTFKSWLSSHFRYKHSFISRSEIVILPDPDLIFNKRTREIDRV